MKKNVFEMETPKLFKFIKEVLNEKITVDKEIIKDILLLMSLNEVDYELADKLCSKFVHDKDFDISKLSVISIGHIARVYKKLVNNELYNYICKIYKDKKHLLYDSAEDVLNDINIFLKIPKPDDIWGIKMKKEDAERKGFVFFKNTAERLNDSINLLFDENDTPIVFPDKEIYFESEKLRIIIRFEEI